MISFVVFLVKPSQVILCSYEFINYNAVLSRSRRDVMLSMIADLKCVSLV